MHVRQMYTFALENLPVKRLKFWKQNILADILSVLTNGNRNT